MLLSNELNELVQYPYSVKQLGRDRNVSLGKNPPDETLANFHVFRETILPPPEHDVETQTCVQDPEPSYVNGQWVLGWSVRDIPPDVLVPRKQSQLLVQIANATDALTWRNIAHKGRILQMRNSLDRSNIEMIRDVARSTGEAQAVIMEDNLPMLITADELDQILMDHALSKMSIKTQAVELKATVRNTNTVAGLNAIDLGIFAPDNPLLNE